MGGDIGSFMSSFFAVDEDQQARFNAAMNASLDPLISKAEAASVAFGTLGNVIGEAIASKSLTFRKFAASMLQALAPVLFAIGAALISRGVLTYNPADVAAGYAAFGAGVAALAAAAFLGRGGGAQARSGGRGGGGGGNGGGGGRGTQNITVVIQGSVDNPDAFARKIAKRLATATADGAA
jgi:uncharacterized membrane protein YgcG